MADYRIGVLGGTFDPIHLGHLIIAEEVRQKLELGLVLFMPAGQPWLKEGTGISAPEHRLEMVKLATASNPHFRVSTLEMERPGPTYTVDTIGQLKAGFGPGSELYFIAGSDALAGLPGWKNPERLLEMCRLAAVRRPGFAAVDLISLDMRIAKASQRIVIAEVPQIDISSSEIRRRINQGLSIKYMVPEAVEYYIMAHKLYMREGVDN
jgi:nicotinate-nucleotide adenylyltransferase